MSVVAESSIAPGEFERGRSVDLEGDQAAGLESFVPASDATAHLCWVYGVAHTGAARLSAAATAESWWLELRFRPRGGELDATGARAGGVTGPERGRRRSILRDKV